MMVMFSEIFITVCVRIIYTQKHFIVSNNIMMVINYLKLPHYSKKPKD